ncbi:MAG TPA: IPT/TIG domain-containing protein [Acidobacteriaceae bacterium]|nr:IPT/TIG domain-containing protein [Acidobacteriaceae bacterium]
MPTLSSVSPASATAGTAAFTITVSGTGFIASSVVNWNKAALTTSYVSGTSVTAEVPAADVATAGTANVTVVNPMPGGGTSPAVSFTISPAPNPVPALSAISPTSATAGAAGLTLTATGTGFISSSLVDWNGAGLTTTYVSSTSLTAQVPAADLTAAGAESVTVVNPMPGGGTSAALSFPINPAPNPVPALSAISPMSATAGAAALMLTATGTGFLASSQVEWNGAALTTTYVSSTSLMAQVPASDLTTANTASVTVMNPAPGGGTSGSVTFTIDPPPNPVPALTSISPTSANAGAAGLTLTATGAGFIASSQITWNGGALTTTYTSDTSLTAQVPAANLATAGTASVAVVNPAPGGGTSNSVTFGINLMGATLDVLSVDGNDLAWDAVHGKLYVAVPSTASANASTITVVDPVAGTVGSSVSLSSAATKLAVSDDDSYLYAAISSGETIQRLALPGLAKDLHWSLGTDPSSSKPDAVTDMAVEPGAAHTLAITFGALGYPPDGLAVYDDGVARPTESTTLDTYSALQWKADGSELYVASISSDTQLYELGVSTSGVSLLATYGGEFRTLTNRLHSDAATGYLYNDDGYVVNPLNGVPVGSYPYGPSNLTIGIGALTVVDPAVGRVFILQEVYEPDGSLAFKIQSFDQNTFRPLSTIVIPNAAGTATNFIPWGESGLAFVTASTPGGMSGQLYILDGTFVNPSGSVDTTAGSAITPVPTLSAMSPLTAKVGSGDTVVTITGGDFLGGSTVYWNGNALATTTVNSSEVQATIPSADLATATQATITVANGGSAVPGSGALYFGVNPAPPAGTQIAVYPAGGNDLKWDANAGKLYVSMPGIQGTEGNSIAIVDPVAGTVSQTGFLGSEPYELAISSDGNYLYVGLNGQNSMEQLALPGFQVNSSWNLGADSFFGPYYALDIEAAPGSPQTTAAILANSNVSPSADWLQIYDYGTARGTGLAAWPVTYAYNSLQWAGDDSTLYSVDQSGPQSFIVLGVGASGATVSQGYNGILNGYSLGIHYDAGTGLVYTDAGQVVNPASGTVVKSLGASGIAVPDSSLDRVFILGQTSAQNGTQNYTIESFDQTAFTKVGSIAIDNVVGTPTALVRWGSNGLAFTTRVGALTDLYNIGAGELYVIAGKYVTAAAKDAGGSESAASTERVHKTWGEPVSPRAGVGVMADRP